MAEARITELFGETQTDGRSVRISRGSLGFHGIGVVHAEGSMEVALPPTSSIWCKTERTRDWVRLLPVISLMMNPQESSATGYSPHELFLGRPAWFLHAPYPEDTHSSVGEWVPEQQAKVDKAKAMLQRVRERQWNKKNKHRVPATYQEGNWVLVHTVDYPPGHAPPAMTHTSGRTRFYQWMDTVSPCGVLPV